MIKLPQSSWPALLILVLCIGGCLLQAQAKRVKKGDCQICKNLVNNFIDGLRKTSKGNFGGGNSAWEDSKLGNYRFSETRFEEIIEHICKESECHELLENQEEKLFAWFKNKQDKIESELLEEFCNNEARACCPSGKFGSKCDPCPTHLGLICSGRGTCEGDGTRGGKGVCLCESAYSGKLCDQCRSGHYEESRNDTHLICSSCHGSCESCNGPEADSCITCKTGWKMNEENNLCEDVNECLKSDICNRRQFCQNMEGSYECINCDPACVACSAAGPDHCVGECNKGYRLSRETDPPRCVDINECLETPNICSNANTYCFNTLGSYECKNNIKKTEDNQPNQEAQEEEDNEGDEEDEDAGSKVNLPPQLPPISLNTEL